MFAVGMIVLAGWFAFQQIVSVGAVVPASGQAVVVPDYLAGHQARPPEGLPVSSHAVKHDGQAMTAETLYRQLLAGQCTASRRFCNGQRELYLCADPVTGLVGGLIIEAGEIIVTGYGTRASYWGNKVGDGPVGSLVSRWGECQ